MISFQQNVPSTFSIFDVTIAIHPVIGLGSQVKWTVNSVMSFPFPTVKILYPVFSQSWQFS